MMRTLTACLALCAVLLGHAGAFLLPASAAVGLRKSTGSGRARAARRGALRMTGDDFEDDFVFARVYARMELEPVQLVLAYMEHAYASESAIIPADLLEAAWSSSPGSTPDDVPQKPDEPSAPTEPIAPPTLPPIGAKELRATPVEDLPTPDTAPEEDADVKHGIVPFASKPPEERVGEEDVASVLARANSMARSSSPSPNSKDVRGNPFFHVKNNVSPFDSSSMTGGQSEDAASVLERTNSMLAGSDPVEAPDKSTKKWAREHTLMSACKWERKMVTEAIIQDLAPHHGGNSTLSYPE